MKKFVNAEEGAIIYGISKSRSITARETLWQLLQQEKMERQ